MSIKPLYRAAVCSECQHASLVPEDDAEPNFCALCGASNLAVPGAKFVQGDLACFEQLERIVHHAQLSKSEATLLAGELESVGRRWEPPDLVLQHLSQRLEGLQTLYHPTQDYSRLVLLASMLLTIVGARMLGRAPKSHRGTRSSGVRRLVFDRDMASRLATPRSKGG
jgi:hypothetical protein